MNVSSLATIYILQLLWCVTSMQMADTIVGCFGKAILCYLHDPTTSEAKAAGSSDSTLQLEGATVPISMSQLKALFYYHLLQIRCNTHTISTVRTEKDPFPRLSEAATGGTVGEVLQSSEDKLGCALYPTASFMNHSCNPNVFFRYVSLWAVNISTC